MMMRSALCYTTMLS